MWGQGDSRSDRLVHKILPHSPGCELDIPASVLSKSIWIICGLPCPCGITALVLNLSRCHFAVPTPGATPLSVPVALQPGIVNSELIVTDSKKTLYYKGVAKVVIISYHFHHGWYPPTDLHWLGGFPSARTFMSENFGNFLSSMNTSKQVGLGWPQIWHFVKHVQMVQTQQKMEVLDCISMYKQWNIWIYIYDFVIQNWRRISLYIYIPQKVSKWPCWWGKRWCIGFWRTQHFQTKRWQFQQRDRCCLGILTQHASVSEKELWPLVCPIEMLVTRFSYPSGMFEPFQLHMMLGHWFVLGLVAKICELFELPKICAILYVFSKGAYPHFVAIGIELQRETHTEASEFGVPCLNKPISFTLFLSVYLSVLFAMN
jgi:hypothetical protein